MRIYGSFKSIAENDYRIVIELKIHWDTGGYEYGSSSYADLHMYTIDAFDTILEAIHDNVEIRFIQCYLEDESGHRIYYEPERNLLHVQSYVSRIYEQLINMQSDDLNERYRTDIALSGADDDLLEFDVLKSTATFKIIAVKASNFHIGYLRQTLDIYDDGQEFSDED